MKVKLYIYKDATIITQIGITADNTIVTSDNTDITADETNSSISSIERIAIPIDLFDDESINVTSSIQNINDISKVFTDYSNSFTIPASKKNNETFSYWYENEIDNGFNQLIRYDGYIEIDDEIFRVGKWQLESASVKQNKIENYKITFYGVLKSLTDKFGEEKLKDLQELNDFSIIYFPDQVSNLITTTNDDNVLFPLISSQRPWQYGGGGVNDISNILSPIFFNELFPAIKIARIFEAIASRYNVSFQGNFLTQSRFTQAYLWLKNKETFQIFSSPSRLNLDNITLTGGQVTFNTLLNEYEVLNVDGAQFSQVKLNISFDVPVDFMITIYKNGIEYINYTQAYGTDINLPGENGLYYITIQTSLACVISGEITSEYSLWDDPFGYFQFVTYQSACSFFGNTSQLLDLTQYVPDMKVSDFFSGILKMFNLTAFSEDESVYTLEQLENWYFQGQIKNFTEYTTTDLEFERIKTYKKVNFLYEKSESLMNRNFFDNTSREYGNLSTTFNTDGSDYEIKLPFENILFNKFTSNNLQVGYSINKNLQTYMPKPVILYKLGNVANNTFYFRNSNISPIQINNYNVFGQDVNYQGEKQTLNWGLEISSYYLNVINNSLFRNYYFEYLNNLYSKKARMVKVEMRLPYYELLNLRLNDRIVIRDKRYVINSYTTNLKTFEVKMELIQDFRSLTFNNSVGRTTDSSAKTLRFDTTSNELLTWTIQQDTNGQIISVNSFDSYVEVETKANTTGVDLFYSIISNNNDTIVITQNG